MSHFSCKPSMCENSVNKSPSNQSILASYALSYLLPSHRMAVTKITFVALVQEVLEARIGIPLTPHQQNVQLMQDIKMSTFVTSVVGLGEAEACWKTLKQW